MWLLVSWGSGGLISPNIDNIDTNVGLGIDQY